MTAPTEAMPIPKANADFMAFIIPTLGSYAGRFERHLNLLIAI